MSFGEANAAAESGWLLTRKAWDNNAYVYSVPAATVKRSSLRGISRSACVGNVDGLVSVAAHYNKIVDGSQLMVGWVPDQVDLRATDWTITNYAGA